MKSILGSVGKRAGTLVVVLHNFDHSGANQYIVNLICELSIRVVVVSPRSGPAISRFTTAGTLCSVQVGDVSEIVCALMGSDDVLGILCNTLMTANIVVRLSFRSITWDINTMMINTH